jgi:hypothetical protein
MISELANQAKKSIGEALVNVHTAIPGKIISFNKDKCEAVVLPYGKYQKPNGEFIDYPKINEVPVMIIQGNLQKSTMVHPVVPGDECLLVISEYTLDTWRTDTESENDLKFDLTNAVAIVGLFSKVNPLASEAVTKDAVIIEHNKNRVIFEGQNKIKVHLNGDTSQITLTPEKISMTTVGDIEIKANGNILIQGAFVDINP